MEETISLANEEKEPEMAETSEQPSFLSLRGSDSGLTLVNTDALIRKCDQQDRLIERKNKQITELEEKIEKLQEIEETCELFATF